MFAAVLDACALVPVVLADTLLRCAERELFRPVWTTQILDEMQRNLPNTLDLAAGNRRVHAMRTHFADAEIKGFEPFIDSMSNNPKDRHVLAAAVAAGAEFIVTANLRDFPILATQPYGIEALHPDDFLCDLLDRHPAPMAQIIAEQAAATGHGGRPRLTVEDVLDGLAGCNVVRFAHLLSRELSVDVVIARDGWQAMEGASDVSAMPGLLEQIRQAEADIAAGEGVDADALRRQLAARVERERRS